MSVSSMMILRHNAIKFKRSLCKHSDALKLQKLRKIKTTQGNSLTYTKQYVINAKDTSLKKSILKIPSKYKTSMEVHNQIL